MQLWLSIMYPNRVIVYRFDNGSSIIEAAFCHWFHSQLLITISILQYAPTFLSVTNEHTFRTGLTCNHSLFSCCSALNFGSIALPGISWASTTFNLFSIFFLMSVESDSSDLRESNLAAIADMLIWFLHRYIIQLSLKVHSMFSWAILEASHAISSFLLAIWIATTNWPSMHLKRSVTQRVG